MAALKMPGSVKAEPEYGKPLDDDALTSYFWECYDDSSNWFTPIWDYTSELWDAYYGETLSDADKKNLQATKRPPINYNLLKGTIDALIGSDQADRKEVVFRGTGPEDTDGVISEWMTRLCRAEMGRNDGYRHESEVLFDHFVGGAGFSETFMDLSKKPMRVPTVRVQPWECYPDPDAVDTNFADGRYFIRERGWTLEEVQARWPDRADEVATKVTMGNVPSFAPNTGAAGRWTKRVTPTRRSRIKVYDFCYKRFVPKVVWTDPETGEEKTTSRGELNDRQKELDLSYELALAEHESTLLQTAIDIADPQGMDPLAAGMPPPSLPPAPERLVIEESYQYPAETFFRAYLLGDAKVANSNVVLEHQEIKVSRFPYQGTTCFKRKKFAEERVVPFGVAHVVLGSQRYLDRSLGVYLDILARGSKGGGFVEKDAIIGSPEKFQTERSTPGMWSIVANGANTEGKIRDAPVQPTPSGFESFLNLTIEMFARQSGVTDAIKGTMVTERSNVLISNMQAQSQVMLNPATDPITAYRMSVGQLRLEMMISLLPAEHLDKMIGDVKAEDYPGLLVEKDEQTGEFTPILDEIGQPLTPGKILKGVNPFDFDVAVDVGQASPTSRQAVWKILEQGVFKSLTETVGAAGLDMAPLLQVLLRNLPLPGDQAKVVGDTYQKALDQKAAMQTQEGVMQALMSMPPDQMQQVLAQVMQQMQGEQGDQQGGQPSVQ